MTFNPDIHRRKSIRLRNYDYSQNGADLNSAPTKKQHGLSEFVRSFKTFSARKINVMRDSARIPVWQRNYYEHIIRNENDLGEIREYIINNPLKWALDEENPANINERQKCNVNFIY